MHLLIYLFIRSFKNNLTETTTILVLLKESI